jgi:hypothetical protein
MTNGIKLDITEAGLKDLVAEALLKTMDEGARDAIIKDAITYLTTEGRGSSYQKTPSPLVEAFRNAIYSAASDLARTYIMNDPEILAQVQSVMVDAFEKVFVTDREAVVDRVAESLRKSFGPESRY